MTTETIIHVGQIRSQLASVSREAERAFERAFDLQQAGAAAERVEAAMAEICRLQEKQRRLSAQLGEPVLH